MHAPFSQAVLTRVNKMTGVAYKDEPAIFAWELMNEPRCQSDLSGKTLQAWITEMASYVKSVDPNHMVEIGLEGFYGESTPDRKRQFNPGGYTVVRRHRLHLQQPDPRRRLRHDPLLPRPMVSCCNDTQGARSNAWRRPRWERLPIDLVPRITCVVHCRVPGASDGAQVAFMRRWMASHAGDAAAVLRKPLLVAEFGWSARSNGYTVSMRDAYFRMVYEAIYASASAGGPLAGGLFWQVMVPGMESWTDGYEVVLDRSPSTAAVVGQECSRMTGLNQVS